MQVFLIKTLYGATGDGVTDDTAAIQAALSAYPNSQRIIYLPNGTYLVSKTLTWPAGTPGTGNEFKNVILQGQNQSKTVVKLKNSNPGFTDVRHPQAVIYTGLAPAQRFGNSIRNLTVDTGVGNAGAIGVQFNASNQGAMRQVTIQSGDGLGVNGLDMNFTDEIGPLLVKGVTVKGFQSRLDWEKLTMAHRATLPTLEKHKQERPVIYQPLSYQTISVERISHFI